MYFYGLELQGYNEVVNIPIAKPGRRLYNIKSLLVDRTDSIIVQIDATEGNKVVSVRSPLQVNKIKPEKKILSSECLGFSYFFFFF